MAPEVTWNNPKVLLPAEATPPNSGVSVTVLAYDMLGSQYAIAYYDFMNGYWVAIGYDSDEHPCEDEFCIDWWTYLPAYEPTPTPKRSIDHSVPAGYWRK